MDSKLYHHKQARLRPWARGGRALPVLLAALAVPAGAATTSAPTTPVAADPPVGTQITTQAALAYSGDSTGPLVATSNPAAFTVGQAVGAQATPPTASQTTTPGAKVYYPLTLTNTGNGPDTYTLTVTAPSGWTAGLIKDDNGDGVHQSAESTPVPTTLPLPAAQSQACFLVLTPPLSLAKTATITATLQMTSQTDATQSGQASTTTTCTGTPSSNPPAGGGGTVAPTAGPMTLAPAWTVATSGPVYGGAVVTGGVAYVGSDDGRLYAAAATASAPGGATPGTILWKLAAGGPVRGTPAVYTTPSGRLLVTVGTENGQLVTADATTGQKQWAVTLGDPWHPVPLRAQPLVSGGGAQVTVSIGDGWLYTYNTADGHLARRTAWLRTVLAGNPAPDAVGHVWMTTVAGTGSEVNDGVPNARRQLALGTTTAAALLPDPSSNSLLAVSTTGKVTSFDLGTLQSNPRWTSVTVAPLIASDPQADAMAAPADEAATPRANAATAAPGVQLGAAVPATPALDPQAGVLYVGTVKHAVYAVKTADGTLRASGWPFVVPGPGQFLASPLLWARTGLSAPLLCAGDTTGAFYAIPTDQPGQPLVFATQANGTGPTAPGEFDAAPAASGTGVGDVIVAGNTNGLIYGFTLR